MSSESEALLKQQVNVLLLVRWPVGGIRTFIKYVIQNFSDRKFKFSFIGVDTEGVRALKGDLGHIVNDWIIVPADGNEFFSLFSELSRFLKNNNVDIIHSHGFISCIASAIPSLIYRVPVVCTSHDVISDNQFSGAQGFFKRSILGLSLRRCNVVHSVSHESDANLKRMFPFLSNRGIIISNGIDAGYFQKAPRQDLKARFMLSDSSSIIGFFGRFMSPKGFRYLIDAAEILAKTGSIGEFYVICFGSGAFIREEQAEIQRRGLESIFIFAPFTSDVSGVMKGCDVIAMPSIWEACPLQPMEALSAGVPFVGSDCKGLRVVLQGTPSIIVKAGDGQSLANGIAECLTLGRKPFEDYAPNAVARFDVKNTVAEIKKMYEKVLA